MNLESAQWNLITNSHHSSILCQCSSLCCPGEAGTPPPQQILYFYQGKIGLFLYGTVECHDIGFKDKSGPCYGNSSTGGNLGSIMESDVSDVMLHGDIVESTCSDVIWMQEDHEM